mmetsp:Transcript_366/g.665  ORF Transcript_366/g.665 Transcript_366/m.665 type:complete len:151 (-) Transcript_366:354-806(-)
MTMTRTTASVFLCMMMTLLLGPVATAFTASPPASSFITSTSRSSTRLNAAPETPFAVIVKAEIEPDRMAEFLEMIETNARETRKEPGCVRFDVLRSQDAPNEFFFYELYKNAAAIDYHKQQPHYNLWADFKASGGTISSTSYKTDAEFLT